MNVTQSLCRKIVATSDHDVSDEAFAHANTLVLDGLAVGCAGAKLESGPNILADNVRDMGSHPQCTVLGFDFRCAPSLAAYVNGTSMHVLDFEPMWSPATHALSTALPVALALGEHLGATGRQIATALIKGIEIQGWLRVASGQLEPRVLRFHPPGLVGPLGAATAAAHLLGLDELQLAHAFGIAASRCGSIFANVGSMTKSTHCGLAASLGLDAALLAGRGFTASTQIFDDPRGYGPAFADDFDAAALLGFGEPFRVVDPSYAIKLYPSQFGTHFAISAGLEAHRTIGAPEQIRHARLVTPDMAYVDRPSPASGLEGKFSWQYTLANALLDGAVGLDTFTDETRFAPRTEAMLDKITIIPDQTIPGRFEDAYVLLSVELDSGTRIDVRSDGPRGKWGQPPLEPDEHERKLNDCFSRCLPADHVASTIDSGRRFSTLDSIEVHALLQLL